MWVGMVKSSMVWGTTVEQSSDGAALGSASSVLMSSPFAASIRMDIVTLESFLGDLRLLVPGAV